MHKKIGIIGADPDNGNRGVGALIYSVLYLIKRIEENHELKIDIFILKPTKGKLNDTFTIGNKSIYIKYLFLTNIFGSKSFLKSILNFKTYLKYLKLDLVFYIGGGDSFSDIYGRDRFNEINNPIKLFRFLRKKQLFLPQTIGPFNESFCKEKAKKSIEAANMVFARDKQSFDYVNLIAKQPNTLESIDVAFLLPYTKKSFEAQLVHVGIGISALLWNGGYTRNNQFNLTVDYQKLIKEIIDFFLSQKNVRIHLVPHVVGINRSIENDYEVSLEVINSYNSEKIILSHLFLDPMEAKSYISGLDFFIGARMHACIAAFSSFVPVFPLSYSRKFNGLFEDTLDYHYVGDLTKYSNFNILDKLRKAFFEREKLKDITRERINNTVAKRLEELLRNIKEYIIAG